MNNLSVDFFSKKNKIVIFGCGSFAKRIIDWIRSQSIETIIMCVDSSSDKQGMLFMDEFVIQDPVILSENCEEYHIIVTPNRYKDIIELLDSYGYIYKKNYLIFDDILKYWANLLVSYIAKQKYKVKFIFAPDLKKMQNYSKTEQLIINMPVALIDRISWLLSFPKHIKECYENFEYYSSEYLKNIFMGSEVLKYNRTYIQKDIRSKYVNVVNGMRLTTDQPKYYEKVIHFFGNSYVYGFGVEDKYTLPSCLQRKLNSEFFWGRYIVFNHGIRGMYIEKYLNKIESVNIKEDDYVLLYFADESDIKEVLMEQEISYIELSEFLKKKRSDDIFFDWESHLNYKGNLVVSDILFKLLFSNNENLTYEVEEEKSELSFFKNDSDLNNYIEMLQKVLCVNNHNINDVNGGIVMNCNPFTLGHRYLIEIASQMVDNLYVFVVSENRSQFDFKDRINMVKKGTQNIKNVTVLPSGKFILSAATFPEYFSKDESQYVGIDMSKDIKIFGTLIAKELGISIRFVGEEPIDSVTKQYNESMKRILPQYNIKVLEIPRIKLNGNYISASVVRELLQKKEWEKLKKYVPESTYQYLINLKKSN